MLIQRQIDDVFMSKHQPSRLELILFQLLFSCSMAFDSGSSDRRDVSANIFETEYFDTTGVEMKVTAKSRDVSIFVGEIKTAGWLRIDVFDCWP